MSQQEPRDFANEDTSTKYIEVYMQYTVLLGIKEVIRITCITSGGVLCGPIRVGETLETSTGGGVVQAEIAGVTQVGHHTLSRRKQLRRTPPC